MMSMIAMQTTIARLCVDLNFRRSFLSSPDATLSGLDLTSDEVERIKSLDMEAVGDYAGSLLAKRIGLIGKWLENPLDFLERHLGLHKASHIAMHYGMKSVRDNEELGGEWVRAEFARFCDYLRNLIRLKEIDVPGFADLLEYEALKFSMTMDPVVSTIAREFSEATASATINLPNRAAGELRPMLGGHAVVRSFEYNVPDYVEERENGNQDAELVREPIAVLFYKNTNQIRVEINIINLPLKDLLEMCDGQT